MAMAPAVRFHPSRAAWLGALFVVVAAHTRAVYAEGQRVGLTYTRDNGAESCPDQLWLKQQIASHLGYDPFIAGHADDALTRQISCRLSKAPNKNEFIATLQTAEPHVDSVGRRELRSGPSCDALAASVVLSLSMAIDPIAAETPRLPAPLPPPTVTHAVPAPQVVEPLHLRLTGSGTMATGWLDKPVAPLASLALHMQNGHWGTFVEVRASAAATTDASNLRTRLLLGGLGVCHTWGPFHICGASMAGPLFVTSPGSVEANHVGTLLAAGPRLLWSRALVGPVHIEAAIEAYANLVRPRVLVNDVVVWRASAGTAAVTLGLGWRMR